MNYVELVGFAAASLTTFAFLPQAIKIHKTQSTKDISLAMFVTTTLGILLWLIYGLLLGLIASHKLTTIKFPRL